LFLKYFFKNFLGKTKLNKNTAGISKSSQPEPIQAPVLGTMMEPGKLFFSV
jgi:hypothetical protein